MRTRHKWNKQRQRALAGFMLLTLVLFLLMQAFFYVDRSLRPAILAIAHVKADIIAIDSVNRAIMEKVARNILYQDLVLLEQDASGKIYMAQLNTMEINRVLAETTIATYDAIQCLEKEPFYIPLGEVFDSYLLATYGPKIPIRLVPIGKVDTNLIDEFESEGINQTRHKIYLKIHTQVRIVIPFISEPVNVYTTVPVADTIYIGDVPDTVINLQFPGSSNGN